MFPCAEQLPILIKKSFTFSDMMKWSLNRPPAQKDGITASNFPAETSGKALTSDYATHETAACLRKIVTLEYLKQL